MTCVVADSFHFCSSNANPQFKKQPRGKEQEALHSAACSGSSWKEGRKRALPRRYKPGKGGGRETQIIFPEHKLLWSKQPSRLSPGDSELTQGRLRWKRLLQELWSESNGSQMKRTRPVQPIAAKKRVRDSRLALLGFSYRNLLGLAVNHPVFDRMTRIAPTNPPGQAAEHPYFTEGSFSWTSHPINHATFTHRATFTLSLTPTPNQPVSLIEWEDLLSLTWIFLLPPDITLVQGPLFHLAYHNASTLLYCSVFSPLHRKVKMKVDPVNLQIKIF